MNWIALFYSFILCGIKWQASHTHCVFFNVQYISCQGGIHFWCRPSQISPSYAARCVAVCIPLVAFTSAASATTASLLAQIDRHRQSLTRLNPGRDEDEKQKERRGDSESEISQHIHARRPTGDPTKRWLPGLAAPLKCVSESEQLSPVPPNHNFC